MEITISPVNINSFPCNERAGKPPDAVWPPGIQNQNQNQNWNRNQNQNQNQIWNPMISDRDLASQTCIAPSQPPERNSWGLFGWFTIQNTCHYCRTSSQNHHHSSLFWKLGPLKPYLCAHLSDLDSLTWSILMPPWYFVWGRRWWQWRWW